PLGVFVVGTGVPIPALVGVGVRVSVGVPAPLGTPGVVTTDGTRVGLFSGVNGTLTVAERSAVAVC
ncbi:MAG: hypothetical protein SH847_06185, partial [Roseiflexaceae bacterium]|nr:hypothetical protein [Roseiflexaceae bacterium]